MTLQEFVLAHTERGECKCGKCFDVGTLPDPVHPHTVDMVFFKVAPHGSLDGLRDEFLTLTAQHSGEFNAVTLLDGKDHSYLELGGWLGDQGLAMQYMALGVMLGVFKLLSPAMLGLGSEMTLQLAGAGYLSVVAKGKE